MTATDELRKLLDERGVEWGSGFGGDTLWTGKDGIEWRWDKQEDTLAMYSHAITPAQAIEATLGPREQPPYDELIEALRRDWDIDASWDGLRRFWYVGLTDEGVRKRDEREATLGRGTCRITDERYKECMALVHEANERIDELRELVLFANKTVEGLCEMVENSPGCFMCPLNQDEDRACGAAELYDRMRGLGVEVDG